MDASALDFGPPILAPPTLPRLLRLRATRRHDVEAPRHGDPRGVVSAADLLLQQRVGDPRSRRPGPRAARLERELDYELEVAALIDTPVRDLDAARGEEAIGGYLVLNDWSARDLQREETTVRLGPAKGKDFASSIGPWLVTPGRAGRCSARQGVRSGDDRHRQRNRAVARQLVDRRTSRFGEMVERASADVRLRPGDLLGSGTVGHRVPARDPRRDPQALPRAGRQRHAGDRPARRADGARRASVPTDDRRRRRPCSPASPRRSDGSPSMPTRRFPPGLTEPDPDHRRALGGRPGLGAPRRVSRRTGSGRRSASSPLPTNEPVPFGRVKTDATRVEAIERDRHTDPSGAARAGPQLAGRRSPTPRARCPPEAWTRRGAHPTRAR